MKNVAKAAANELAVVAGSAAETPQVVNKMKNTFHVGMLLLGCGTPEIDNPKGSYLGTNLLEVSMLNIALSRQRIGTKYYSIDTLDYDIIEGTSAQSEDKPNPLKKKHSEESRNLMEESARITRGSKDLYTLDKLKVDSLKALIIPSFTHFYSKNTTKKIYDVPMIRSTI